MEGPPSHSSFLVYWKLKSFVQRAIEVFGITEPMIPQRAKSKTRIGSKWYG